jgi:hypothetical protein
MTTMTSLSSTVQGIRPQIWRVFGQQNLWDAKDEEHDWLYGDLSGLHGKYHWTSYGQISWPIAVSWARVYVDGFLPWCLRMTFEPEAVQRHCLPCWLAKTKQSRWVAKNWIDMSTAVIFGCALATDALMIFVIFQQVFSTFRHSLLPSCQTIC